MWRTFTVEFSRPDNETPLGLLLVGTPLPFEALIVDGFQSESLVRDVRSNCIAKDNSTPTVVKVGDRLFAINKNSIESLSEGIDALRNLTPGQVVTLTFIRLESQPKDSKFSLGLKASAVVLPRQLLHKLRDNQVESEPWPTTFIPKQSSKAAVQLKSSSHVNVSPPEDLLMIINDVASTFFWSKSECTAVQRFFDFIEIYSASDLKEWIVSTASMMTDNMILQSAPSHNVRQQMPRLTPVLSKMLKLASDRSSSE